MTTTSEKNRITAKFRKLFPNIADFRSYSFEKEIRDNHLPEFRHRYGWIEINFRDMDWRKSESWNDLDCLLESIDKINNLIASTLGDESIDLENADKVSTTVVYISKTEIKKNHVYIWEDLRRCPQTLNSAINLHALEFGDELHSYGLSCSLSNRPSNWISYYPEPEPECEVIEGDEVAVNTIHRKKRTQNYIDVVPLKSENTLVQSFRENLKGEKQRYFYTSSYGRCCSLGSRPKNVLEKPKADVVKDADEIYRNHIYPYFHQQNEVTITQIVPHPKLAINKQLGRELTPKNCIGKAVYALACALSTP